MILRKPHKVPATVRSLASHVYRAWLNGRTFSQTVFVVLKNGMPLLLWLLFFNTVGLIPNRYKPKINVRLISRLDNYVFDNVYGGTLTVVCLALAAVLMYQRFVDSGDKREPKVGGGTNNGKKKDPESLVEPVVMQTDDTFWSQAPVWFVVTSWAVLNGIYYFKDPVSKVKNIIALIFYVIGHVLIVPVSIGYMYMFQPPKILKTFVIIIGLQNICVNITHLVFPNVPPIYIEYYGENKLPNYDSPGYSEGLTRIDLNLKFNRIINFFIIYVKSIEFGILPSLHSSMSITICYFLINLVKYRLLKVVFIAYMYLQIWSALYLDHHWRIDIMFSFIYSTLFFLMVKDRVMLISSRFKYNSKFGETSMGMRLFRGTALEWWFNPK